MATVILVIHLLIAIALVGVVLLQRSEGGGLGMSSGGGGFMTGRGQANLLTRTTAVLAAAFFTTSILLSILAQTATLPAYVNRYRADGENVPEDYGLQFISYDWTINRQH